VDKLFTGLFVHRNKRIITTTPMFRPKHCISNTDANVDGTTQFNNNHPLVTVIIPSYNHEKFIREAIYSVVNQTYKNIELIIIDDGSTDSSPSLIEDALQQIDCPKVKFFVQENCGAHNTINRGISMAKGEYIAILNSDDIYYPHRIENLLVVAMRNGCEFAFSKVDHISSDGTYLGKENEVRSVYLGAYEASRSLPSIGFSLMKFNLAHSTSNFFMHKPIIDRVGLLDNYKAIHDWDYLLRVLLDTEPCFLDEPLMAYRVHESNTFPTLIHLGKEELDRMFSHYANAIASGKARNPLAPPLPHSRA